MIADCETCGRKQAPCKSCQESQRAICYRCDGDVDDPYCEMEDVKMMPTPAEIAASNVAYDKANNPFYHAKRFEIQVHKGGERENIYLPTWQLVAIVLSTKKFNAEDPKRPDRVIVSDNRDTYSRVLEFEKSWYGYETRLCRGAARGDEPRGFEAW